MSASLQSSRRRWGRQAHRKPMSDINVTPMVDVMLVLLIIFMVTATIGVTLMSDMGLRRACRHQRRRDD